MRSPNLHQCMIIENFIARSDPDLHPLASSSSRCLFGK